MMHLSLHNKVVPLVILKENKHEYIQFLEKHDIIGFSEYAAATI